MKFMRDGLAGAWLALLLLGVGPVLAGERSARLTPVDPSGLEAVLASHAGKVVLVNFWATWCRPCLKEIPDLKALEARHGPAGLVLVAVSLDDPGDLQGMVRPFMDKWFPDFSSYIRTTADMDSLVSVIDPAWNELLPTSYILDRRGKVRARLQGGKPGAEFEKAILPLLAER